MKKAKATIHFNEAIQEMGSEGSVIVFVNECVVERCVHEFGELFEANHKCVMKVKNGTAMMRECECLSSTSELTIKSIVMAVEGGELEMDKCVSMRMKLRVPLMEFIGESKAIISETRIDDLKSEGNVIEIGDTAKVELKELDAENITISRSGSVAKIQNAAKRVGLSNCSFGKCFSSKEKGTIVFVNNCVDAIFDSCNFLGDLGNEAKEESRRNDRTDEICKWNGSLVDVVKSSVMMKDTTIANSPDGGITMSGGKMIIEAGNFSNNNPSIEKYTSLRRNIICSDSGTLNVVSLKGGDGWKDNSSLWMLNDGCSFEGIVSERASPFFIPVLESVEAKEEADRMKLTFKGMLLVPCNISFSVVKKKGEEKEIEHYDFDSNGFLSEREVEGSVAKDKISNCGSDIEVSVHILFENSNTLFSTNSFILKNASGPGSKDDERIVKGGKDEKSSWALIVIVIFAVLFLIALIGFIMFVVRWRKARNEAKDLREIVNDTVKKDPKLIEMITMEMSPEEQWRRAEREAEKKNEERIKKRVCDSNLEHSESSEHLLSESGSTEYILGRDSDKIPEWALEKEEEEEIRKRTPSPSISSISTSSTTDTDTTFVRGEDLCPTTSSMSNLVDAMACSSPHEKLIVDLRDSLFMLLHGRNEKKEMAIGTLQEREQTAAQILFWVANLALHSFDEMENGLSSLSTLSPHIVLFSEHMVICIVMHSDFSSSDSDSSSISSTTVVTSASDDDDDSDSLPSSAFGDENDYKKESLRWMAPELLMNRKMGATKKSVVFSIGMMLWECLTLEIPFGEYPAEVAGQKIANGERPDVARAGSPDGVKAAIACLSMGRYARPTLTDLKRAFISHFPAGCAVLTVSDAIGLEETTDRGKIESGSALSGSAQSGDAQSGSVVSGYSTFE
ncbi:uncharacterized protein MONOS_14718 [Monocercomonoides exilis]|uniref:uncharacterized protein n=1 Tax=Monocercomonoides exilis TaxID=2049356 RepID=UPI0035595D44|nr:hypothetical protein MONOS_14718 [Monocercomonoides exilis]